MGPGFVRTSDPPFRRKVTPRRALVTSPRCWPSWIPPLIDRFW